MLKIKMAALLLSTVVLPSLAEAKSSSPCSLDLENIREISWRGPSGRGYEAAVASLEEPSVISVRHKGDACKFFLVISDPDHELSGPGSSLHFDVLDAPSGRSILSPDAGPLSQRRIPGSFSQGDDEKQQPVFIALPSGQNVRSGSYSGSAVISLYRDEATPELVRQVPLSISARVPPLLSVSSSFFAGSYSSSIDLGRLEKGASALVDFSVTSNTGVAVRLESSNKGQLRHQYGVSSIPYRASLAGRNINLKSQSGKENFSLPTGIASDIPLEIEVDAVPNALAGNYSDIMTITFSAEG